MAVSFSRRFHTRRWSVAGYALLLALLTGVTPAPAAAQGDDDPHFGVGVSFAPFWKSRSDLLVTTGLEDVGTIEGTEFSIGLVRGRTRGGEWGVSFVRKPFKDSTTVFQEQSTQDCGPSCVSSFSSTRTTRFDAVYLRGVEVHWAPAFVTIGGRVQIGLNVAGGIAIPEGTVHDTVDFTSSSTFQGRTFTDAFSDSFSSPAKDVLFGKVPLFKVEVQGALILAPGLKVKISGGLNNPGMGMRIGATYLFGAN